VTAWTGLGAEAIEKRKTAIYRIEAPRGGRKREEKSNRCYDIKGKDAHATISGGETIW